MKYGLLLFIFLCNTLVAQTIRESGNLVLDNIPEAPDSVMEKLSQYQNMRSGVFLDWLHGKDGMLISTRFGDLAQVHHVRQAGAYRQQITFFKDPSSSVMVCPDPRRNGYLFSKDAGGNENFQLYYYDLNTDTYQLLSDGHSRYTFSTWNKKGTKIAYFGNQRNANDLDLYVQSPFTREPARLVLKNTGGGWEMRDWSADDRYLLIANRLSENEAYLFRFDLQTNKLDSIHPQSKKISYTSARFTPDGKGMFVISDEDTEFKTLRYYSFASGKLKNLTSKLNWDVAYFTMSDDGHKIAFVANEGGYSQLYLMDTQTRNYKAVTTIPKGNFSGMAFHKDNQRLGFTLARSNAPADVYVYHTGTGQLTRWTYSETGGIPVSSFAEATLIEYPTFDSLSGKVRMIPAIYYQPKDARGKIPVLLDIHGGPEGQSLPLFNPFHQYLLKELKIAVIVPNVRGSTGYGKTYVKLDDGYLRENSVRDIGSLLDWVARQPQLDAGRVAVYGGSYGGYMSLACMTHFNDRLRCGVDLFGISNFVTFLQNTSGYRRDLRRVEYGDERDPDMKTFLTKVSPVNSIGNISKPMLIFQGKNDPRVPLSESEQMVAALKQKGNSIWYIMAKDEGHGITKKANRDVVQASVALFFKQYLIQ